MRTRESISRMHAKYTQESELVIVVDTDKVYQHQRYVLFLCIYIITFVYSSPV